MSDWNLFKVHWFLVVQFNQQLKMCQQQPSQSNDAKWKTIIDGLVNGSLTYVIEKFQSTY